MTHHRVNSLSTFRQAIRRPDHLFADTLDFIDRNYSYQPCAFSNASLHNKAGENAGSCKILGLALLEQLTKEETLLAFGEHYRHILAKPYAQDHQNIRQLLRQGLAAVHFTQPPLIRKTSHTPAK